MDDGRSVLDRALDAAVELVSEEIPALPPLPTPSVVRAEFGLGVSSFYRLFGSTEHYRELLVESLFRGPYLAAEGPLLETLAEIAEGISDDVDIDHAGLLLLASASFDTADPGSAAPEAEWLPWLENDSVRRWIDDSVRRSFEAELGPIEETVRFAGLRFSGSQDGSDFFIRQMALTVGAGVCGICDVEWDDGEQTLPLRLAARWRLGLLLLELASGSDDNDR